ncbi:MAG: hypothetical protein Phyf2KO_11080 [Phycisphaerales bacterium]
MKLRGWSAKDAGARFVVHPNTIRIWQKAVRDKLRAEQLLGGPPWNRLHSGVRRLIHKIRDWPIRSSVSRITAEMLLKAVHNLMAHLDNVVWEGIDALRAATSDSKPELTAGRSAQPFLLLFPLLARYSFLNCAVVCDIGPDSLSVLQR